MYVNIVVFMCVCVCVCFWFPPIITLPLSDGRKDKEGPSMDEYD